ncbi:stress-induced protein sti1, putative [Trypanosoma equiperdum]|uniref:Stress-induced protein sti1, putative n=4 Tax=Trypanozoon TaxID=39700 RepID=Q57ZX0_TRYB2|nr:stress-induced protein sti1, putative [Trypanosoma brucei gambiense DAL972]XP_844966.1 stress-induced protein sti1, putative [Trypanosoma brucei brucei TREU927]AAX79355.1 stress-induced protein sti1, putative [Trypanosoma brucei]RHW72416.1 stress-induced protein sti1 [Trypanosoma brucei equiperdum]SCU65079.1 stress-induced protein sti1, putative [Trypanosoma equiperdum]AAZ11407.1 stress-induced protein sti1, putative [Trypanosoma brucei brucei TREU927]CBH11274.1 stress-induced protein sti1|eukprot:XP_011773561.1 stress-induced protein sti1, putative [Trypanosoma brucei gambiense DAL972]
MDATELKNKGNQEFSSGRYREAAEFFSQAINLDPSNHVLYSNRSACFASLHQYAQALSDAEKCVSLKPDWVKGYVRHGAALHGLRRYDEAAAVYKKGLTVDPSSTACSEGIASVEKDKAASAMQNPFAKLFTPEAVKKIQSHRKLSLFMMQPDYVRMIDEVIKDPSNIQRYLEDQRFMMTCLVLSGMNIPVDDDDEEEERPKPEAPKKNEEPKKAAAVELSAEAKEALRAKEEGNALYKQRKFDEALAKYDEASSLDPTNTVYLLNITAVFYEKGEYELCMEKCENALEHGRENKCDYTVIAKLMTRQALCLQKLKRFDEAIALFKKALVEHRNPDTLAKLNACEKEKAKFEADAYIDPAIAQEKKDEGNSLFKQDKFPEAVAAYTESIKRNPMEHTTYSNRAAAYLKLGAYNEALADAEKCIEIKPDFVKAHARRGHAFFWTKQYNKAMQAYDEGLKYDKENAECKDGRMRTMMKIQEMASGQSEDGDEVAKRAMADPEVAAIMQDSYMQLVLNEMQRDPTRIKDYMRDPTLAKKINTLVSAGIIRFGQ